METVLDRSQIQSDMEDTFVKDGMEKILITGASGFLGRKLFDRLDGKIISNGRFVRPMSRSWTKRDVCNKDDVDSQMQQVAGGYVYHLASKVSFNHRDEKEIFETNVKGTQNVLESAKKYGIKKVVVVSSACTVGSCNNPFHEKNETSEEKDQSNPYVRSKIHQEILARSAGAVVVCPSTCFLPMMAGRIIPSGGTNVLDADDAIEGMIYAMKHGRARQKYLLAGHNVSYRELYDMAGRRYIVAPRWAKGILKFAAQFDDSWYMSPYTVEQSFRFKYYNCEKAKKELGWEPLVKLETMLKQR